MSDQDHPLEPFKRATTATIRAIAGDDELEVTFGQGTPSARGNRIRVPLPTVGCTAAEVDAVRGMGDEFALKVRYHDSGLHDRLSPHGGAAEEMFQWIEDARIASIGSLRMEGVAQNLDASLEVQCKQASFDAIVDESEAPLSVAVGLLVRQALTGRELPPSAEHVVQFWRDYVNEHAGPDIDALRECVYEQQDFARVCRSIIADLGLAAELNEPPDSADDNDDIESMEDDQQNESELNPDDVVLDDDSLAEESMDGDTTMVEMDADFDMDEQGAEADQDENPAQLPDEAGRIRVDFNYAAYTEEFDEVVRAEELCDPDEMLRLRALLDQQLVALQHATSKLANRLQRRLMAKQNRTWEFDLEEGILDASRLAQVIVDPMNPLAYKQEKQMEFRDTVVTMLIDSSGSMRGRSITIAAMCADILGRTLERCSVRVEILGFTTRAWRGGQSRENWIAAGKPSTPGRLNDLRHIVYKAADDTWHRTRRNLGLMMREELLKENIDGEALIWAHNRIVTRTEQRKVLMVISDGLPVDNSTLLVNPSNYLEQHLKYAIDSIESHSPVELIAIGIGHDVTHHYRRAVTITDAEQLGGAMTDQLAELFEIERK
ncbi:MAG: cobaltochelatase subunit CobT [Pseudomonadales bacterium]|jgi:cobaltochelatase CobT|nr:cobaltochelatase subunit CobT [Pseudomonadales bacterium]MDP6470231.1 cobaltochelatase subunit CobT [Pseudomonadales bacterium]MDP6827137.1 cobaltochelatase subunit CobT [Pseudomonadales bacterium]MDP6971771.1 cobaltochelatase subunit CobT [Pseudomonadales bacterium]|tara:strand:- start:2835 stop:4649 length:1815 start_codon:yes stop_codon:yes gene_type:complete